MVDETCDPLSCYTFCSGRHVSKEVPVEELIPARIQKLAEEARRRRERNFSRRARYAAYRSAGMVKTPYGWE